jgi:hypothetical protein
MSGPGPGKELEQARRVINQSERENLYERLGLSEKASPDDIKRAYYSSAILLHPDTAPAGLNQAAAKEALSRITQAYTVLSNADSKENYDKTIEQQRANRQLAQSTNGLVVPPQREQFVREAERERTDRAKAINVDPGDLETILLKSKQNPETLEKLLKEKFNFVLDAKVTRGRFYVKYKTETDREQEIDVSWKGNHRLTASAWASLGVGVVGGGIAALAVGGLSGGLAGVLAGASCLWVFGLYIPRHLINFLKKNDESGIPYLIREAAEKSPNLHKLSLHVIAASHMTSTRPWWAQNYVPLINMVPLLKLKDNNINDTLRESIIQSAVVICKNQKKLQSGIDADRGAARKEVDDPLKDTYRYFDKLTKALARGTFFWKPLAWVWDTTVRNFKS